MIRAAQARAARKRYRQIAPVLNEQSRRRFVALEAQALGRGGVSLMARITGLARSTIYHGLSDIRNNVAAAPGRVRKAGGGRKKKTLEDPTLSGDLKALVEPVTRGDPMRPLLWTCRSLRNLVKELANKGLGRVITRWRGCRRAATGGMRCKVTVSSIFFPFQSGR
jgi:hypothetical protein